MVLLDVLSETFKEITRNTDINPKIPDRDFRSRLPDVEHQNYHTTEFFISCFSYVTLKKFSSIG